MTHEGSRTSSSRLWSHPSSETTMRVQVFFFFMGKLTTLAHTCHSLIVFLTACQTATAFDFSTSADICMATKQISSALLYISREMEGENQGLIHWGLSKRDKTEYMRNNNSLTANLYINWANMFTASSQNKGLLWRYGVLSNCRAGFPKWNYRGVVS